MVHRSLFVSSGHKEDAWTHITNPAERRRIQNRIAQRTRRKFGLPFTLLRLTSMCRSEDKRQEAACREGAHWASVALRSLSLAGLLPNRVYTFEGPHQREEISV
jgi:hypothetical protein